MNSLEHLVELIETQSPTHITILAPVFNPTFLWKLSKDVGLYKRKNLEELKVFILKFSDGDDQIFFLNECIELQELFPKICLYMVDLSKAKDSLKMAPGVILLANETPRAFAFEREFSSQGFEISCVLSGIPLSRGLEIFGDLENQSHRITRDFLDNIGTSLKSDAPLVFSSKYFDEKVTFDLSFVSSKTKEIHNAGAGLNWGQHTSSRGRKDLNAAYIHVPKSIQGNQLLPSPGTIFSCQFEDGIEFDMVRTGEGGKNLTSAYENQILGRYVRYKLGVPLGSIIDHSKLSAGGVLGISFIRLSKCKYLAKFNNSSISCVYEP